MRGSGQLPCAMTISVAIVGEHTSNIFTKYFCSLKLPTALSMDNSLRNPNFKVKLIY